MDTKPMTLTHPPFDHRSLYHLTQHRDIELSVSVRVVQTPFQWNAIAQTLKTHTISPQIAKPGDIIAVSQRYIKSDDHGRHVADAGKTHALAFNLLQDTPQDMIDTQKINRLYQLAHDHDQNTTPEIPALLGTFCGRSSLAAHINNLWALNILPRHTEPALFYALYRPEGIILYSHKPVPSTSNLLDYLQNAPDRGPDICQILLPEAKSGHEALKQKEDIQTLLTLTNLYTLSLGYGSINWTS